MGGCIGGRATLAAVGVTVMAAGAVMAVSATSAVGKSAAHAAVSLADSALIMGATGISLPDQGYVDAATDLYLQPLGFEGDASALYVPLLAQSTDVGLPSDADYIVSAVQQWYDSARPAGDDTLWLFGYSQSAAAAAIAADRLQQDGIPADALHFVLVGDSASAHGGFLPGLLDSLPSWLREVVTPLLGLFGIADSVGLTTPDFYDTDVYTLTGDGYANWPGDVSDVPAVLRAVSGMFSDHLLYLGLQQSQIPEVPEFVDGATSYFTIDSDSIDAWQALITAGERLDFIPDWLGSLIS